MLTIEAARRVTKTKENQDDMPRFSKAIGRLFSIEDIENEYNSLWNNWNEENTERQRLKGYWITRWLCTDTHVGEMAYFLDDELVMTCVQTARKSDAAIYFVDQAAYDKVKAFMDYFRTPAELDGPEFIGAQVTNDLMKFEYADSCLHRVGTYQGREVEVGHIPYNIRKDLNLPGSEGSFFYSLFPYVYVVENGTKTPVNIKELEFTLHIDGK